MPFMHVRALLPDGDWSEPASSLILNSESLCDKVRLKLRLFLYILKASPIFTRGAFLAFLWSTCLDFKKRRNCVDFIIYDLVHHVLCSAADII